jgi:Cytochrome P460
VAARTLALALGAAALVVGVTVAQARSDASPRALPGLPQYTAGYKSWPRINRTPIRGGSPAHVGTKIIYASRRKTGARYPYGTVIVKEGFRPGQRSPYLIAVMRKVRGASPRNNDWVMIEWTRPGTRGRFSELARGQVCYGCHVGARENDYVFTRR